MLERAPDVLGAVGEEDKAGHPLRERGLQRGHDRLILSDPSAVEGIGRSNPCTVSDVGRDRAWRAGDTPIDEAVQVAAAEERQNLGTPVHLIVRREPDGDEVGQLGGAGNSTILALRDIRRQDTVGNDGRRGLTRQVS
jgi:hypothetical protein